MNTKHNISRLKKFLEEIYLGNRELDDITDVITYRELQDLIDKAERGLAYEEMSLQLINGADPQDYDFDELREAFYMQKFIIEDTFYNLNDDYEMEVCWGCGRKDFREEMIETATEEFYCNKDCM